MLSGIGRPGGVRALWVMASSLMVRRPICCAWLRKMRNFDFLAVSDIFLSETAALADVVPPTTQWAEESGIMTNLDGRVILRQAAVTSPGEVRTDLDVIADLAKRVGAQGFSADAQE